MYKVYASDTHFVMYEKRMSTGATGVSLVARYNKELPGLEEVFLEALKSFQCQELKGLKKDEYKNLRLKVITNAIESFIAYDYNLDYLKSQGYDFADYTERALHRHWLNKHNRRKRFERKADLNMFNYFVTVTRDDRLFPDDISFKKSLLRSFANLHTRRGWLIMGHWERSPEEQRLHFHGFFYVPKDEMVGALIVDESYNFKRHKREKRMLNTFFTSQFGRTDFVDISDAQVFKSTLKNYITKYIYKSDDTTSYYSRGIATYIESDLPLEEYIFCEANEIAKSYYLADNTFYCDVDTRRYLMYDLDLVQTHNRIHLRV